MNLSIGQTCQTAYPNLSPTFDFNYLELREQNTNNLDYFNKMDKIIVDAWRNPLNKCIFDNEINILPQSNAIYFITDDYYNSNQAFALYREYLSESNKYILSSSVGKDIPRYQKYFSSPNLFYKFQVSPSEGHPNALANQMYADILFNEITTNPKWGFIK